MHKSLILGAGGFLGTNLLLRLTTLGEDVRAFGRSPKDWQPPASVEWIDADFLDAAALKRALQGVDIVYHLISTTVPSSSRSDFSRDVVENVAGTVRLLDSCVESGVKKIVFASSGGTVYGRVKNVPITENTATDPISSYGISKLAIEKYLNIYSILGLIRPITLRIANPFGPFQRASHNQGAIAVFTRQALRGETIEIWGDGSVVRDYLYIDDIIDALIVAAQFEGHESVFNIGSGLGRSLTEILSAIERELGGGVRTVYRPGRAVDVPINVLDISKASDLLGWAPRTPFEVGLARTVAWMREGHRSLP